MTMPRPASPRDKLLRRCEDLVAAEMTRRAPTLSGDALAVLFGLADVP